MSKRKRAAEIRFDVSRLIDVSAEAEKFRGENHPQSVYADIERGWCVQVFGRTTGCDGTPWEGTLRVGVTHTTATTNADFFKREYGGPITWDDLQAIKDRYWPSRIAVEVYPPHECIVDVANMRWLWVLPQGAILPFNLQARSTSRLAS